MRSVNILRGAVAASGLGMCAFGILQFVDRTSPDLQDVIDVLVWLGGAIVLHDGILVPLVLAVGWCVMKAPFSGALRGGLLTASCLTLIALPMMLRAGKTANNTVLPMDYVANWVIVLAVTVVATGGVALFSHHRSRNSQDLDESRP
ncbi:hypothetical protein [Streptomyces nigra]|uniref:hypothetical protein n=1 Tax=Streptomyces nigra TaxID=1827580 RepID=UPI00381F171C